MNFFIVFCKEKKKFEKYMKLNKLKNKVIVDIKEMMYEENLYHKRDKDYFNLIVYTKITHALQKGKNIYYIPDFSNKTIDITQIFKVKEVFNQFEFNFNILIFYKDFINDDRLKVDAFSNLTLFDNSQIIEDF